MFVDASAIVAIRTREAEADALANVLQTARSPITSSIAIFEAALGICRKRHASVEEAASDVREFLDLADVRTVAITGTDATTALAAFSRYGKGRDHPAQQDGRVLGHPFHPALRSPSSIWAWSSGRNRRRGGPCR
jgi:ribonuclease VapC